MTRASEHLSQAVEEALLAKREVVSTRLVTFAHSDSFRFFHWRESGRTPYEILVAELMLRRTTAPAVARVYDDFLTRFPTLQALNEATEPEVTEALARLGLQQQRARGFKSLASHLVHQDGCVVPDDLTRLLSAPNIGGYVARAVLSFAFDQPFAVVDTNVERVLGRVFLTLLPIGRHPSPSVWQEMAGRLLPTNEHRAFNFGILDLATLICRPKDPRCPECPLLEVCDYGQNATRSQHDRHANEASETAPSSVGSRLRKSRQNKRMSLECLAAAAQMPKYTLIRIESGRVQPRRATIERLASALDVPLCELIEELPS